MIPGPFVYMHYDSGPRSLGYYSIELRPELFILVVTHPCTPGENFNPCIMSLKRYTKLVEMPAYQMGFLVIYHFLSVDNLSLPVATQSDRHNRV